MLSQVTAPIAFYKDSRGGGSFHLNWLTLIPPWLINGINYIVWYESTYLLIHLTGHVLTYAEIKINRGIKRGRSSKS